ERDILPGYLRARRWFAQKDERRIQVSVPSALCFTLGTSDCCWLIAEVQGKYKVAYSLPVVDEYQPGAQPPPQSIIAKLRRGYREGFLLDALFGDDFIRAAVEAIQQSSDIAVNGAKLSFRPTQPFLACPVPEKPVIRIIGQEQSNTSAIIEEW